MYRVRYKRRASNQLAAIWTAATDRQAVTDASYRVDQALASDPENQGESRPGNRRIMFDAPLAVTYRIDEANRWVVMSNVRAFGPRRANP